MKPNWRKELPFPPVVVLRGVKILNVTFVSTLLSKKRLVLSDQSKPSFFCNKQSIQAAKLSSSMWWWNVSIHLSHECIHYHLSLIHLPDNCVTNTSKLSKWSLFLSTFNFVKNHVGEASYMFPLCLRRKRIDIICQQARHTRPKTSLGITLVLVITNFYCYDRNLLASF